MSTNGKRKLNATQRRIQNEVDFLSLLCKSNEAERSYLIHQLTPNQMQVLIDILRNGIRGNLPLSVTQISHLKPWKRHVHALISSGAVKKKKRRILRQFGKGIFSILIPTVASLLGSLLIRK